MISGNYLSIFMLIAPQVSRLVSAATVTNSAPRVLDVQYSQMCSVGMVCPSHAIAIITVSYIFVFLGSLMLHFIERHIRSSGLLGFQSKCPAGLHSSVSARHLCVGPLRLQHMPFCSCWLLASRLCHTIFINHCAIWPAVPSHRRSCFAKLSSGFAVFLFVIY